MLLTIKALSLVTSQNAMLLEFSGIGKILYNLKKISNRNVFLCFFSYLCQAILSFTVLLQH